MKMTATQETVGLTSCHIRQLGANYDGYCLGSRTDDAEAPIASEEGEESFNKLLELTRRKLRWGAMELTRRPEESISSEGEVLFHLGFGGEEHHISEPKDGQHYI